MFRPWKIVALVLVVGLTGSLVYLFIVGRLLGVVVRVLEVVGRLGRRLERIRGIRLPPRSGAMACHIRKFVSGRPSREREFGHQAPASTYR